MTTASFAHDPSSDATLKAYNGTIVARDNASGTVIVETNHSEPQCKRITLTAVQCAGGLPGLFTRGRVYTRITAAGAVWFFKPSKG